MSTSWGSGSLFLACSWNLAPSSLGVSVHAWKNISLSCTRSHEESSMSCMWPIEANWATVQCCQQLRSYWYHMTRVSPLIPHDGCIASTRVSLECSRLLTDDTLWRCDLSAVTHMTRRLWREAGLGLWPYEMRVAAACPRHTAPYNPMHTQRPTAAYLACQLL